MARQIMVQLGWMQQGDFRRLLGVSALFHVGLVVVFAFSPSTEFAAPRGVVAVELVTAPAAKPRPAPAPARPKPKPPVAKKVVLPAEPSPPKPKPAKPELSKPAAPPKPEAPPKAEAPPDQDYADVMAQLREELGDEAPVAEAAAPAAVVGRPTGGPMTPELRAWLRSARVHVRQNWVVPPGFRTQSLQAVIEVELDSTGAVVGEPRVLRRSGNPWYDDGVVRSIRKASPLPAPPQAGPWTFVMLSDEEF